MDFNPRKRLSPWKKSPFIGGRKSPFIGGRKSQLSFGQGKVTICVYFYGNLPTHP